MRVNIGMNRNKILVISIFVLFFGSNVNATNIDDGFKYAWGSNCGWINFGTLIGNVVISNDKLIGYAWNDNYGWINLAPSAGGIINNNGKLSGLAWGEGLGYVDFNGVSINSDGYFLGYASSTNCGLINFNCANTNNCTLNNFKVRTTWRPVSNTWVGGCGDLCQAGIMSTPTLIPILHPTSIPTVIPLPVSTPVKDPLTLTVSEKTINASKISKFIFSRNLKLSMIGNDVKELQKFLNNQGFIVAEKGAGSLGNETNYFGLYTKRALIKFQEKFAENILNPLSLLRGTGIFGDKTRNFINNL